MSRSQGYGKGQRGRWWGKPHEKQSMKDLGVPVSRGPCCVTLGTSLALSELPVLTCITGIIPDQDALCSCSCRLLSSPAGTGVARAWAGIHNRLVTDDEWAGDQDTGAIPCNLKARKKELDSTQRCSYTSQSTGCQYGVCPAKAVTGCISVCQRSLSTLGSGPQKI